MKIRSVNAGRPRTVSWDGREVTTSIFKEPVAGRRRVTALNVEGDRQSDGRVHGGPAKAVYAYPFEHYAYWAPLLAVHPMTPGTFGENLTLEGWLEESVHIGDHFRAGDAEFVVTQPRLPCFKLGIRLGDQALVARFMESGRTGFYLSVAREGEIGAGDGFDRVAEDPRRVSVRDVWRLHFEGVPASGGAASAPTPVDRELLAHALTIEALPPFWKKGFARRLGEVRRPNVI